MEKKTFIINITFIIISLLLPAAAWSKDTLDYNAGGRVIFGTWEGENDSDGSNFDADTVQIGADFIMRFGKFYTGVGVIAGEFDFIGNAPDRPTRANPPSTRTRINRGEINMIVGYYIIPQVSVFLDAQVINNKWVGEDYEISYNGLGFGASAHAPITKEWIIFGSIGVVPVNIEENDKRIGNGRGSSLEIGGMYVINKTMTMSASIRAQGREFDYDTAPDQTHDVGGLQFRFNKAF